MVFSSLVFICVFLPVVLLLHQAIPGIKGKNAVLIVASLIFYAYGEPLYIVLMIVSTLMNWALGLAIRKRVRRASGVHGAHASIASIEEGEDAEDIVEYFFEDIEIVEVQK